MQKRQLDRKQYFDEQSYTTANYVIPFIEKQIPITASMNILEVGCGEGGNLEPFLNLGCKVTGIDIMEFKITNARNFYENHPQRTNLNLIQEDVYKVDPDSLPKFDLITMRDTLEHIPDQEKFLEHLRKFLKPEGKVFMAFPPWRMPFGGHQQMCKSRILSRLPYYHILPNFLYVGLLKLFGEKQGAINGLLETKSTRISLNRFHRIVKRKSFRIESEAKYLINPNYEIKFGLKPKLLPVIFDIPFLRDFYITTYYCLISKIN